MGSGVLSSARPGVMRAMTVAVMLLGGLSLGALRVTPGGEAGPQAFDVVGVSTAPGISAVAEPTTTATVPPTTVAPTTAPPTTARRSPTQAPLSPLPPSPSTTRPAPATTSPPTTAVNQPPVARDDGSPSQRIAIAGDSQQNAIRVTANDFDPDGSIDRSRLSAYGGSDGTVLATNPSEGIVYYSPPPGFRGVDAFQYTIWDDDGRPAQATVYVRVT